MAFEIRYTNCSPETQNEIETIIELWNKKFPVYYVKTSGSTGEPKTITLTREQLEASAKRSNRFFGLGEESLVFMCLSPATIGGKMMIIRALTGNYSIEVAEPSANPVQESDPGKRYSFISLVPFQVKRILGETPEKLEQFDQILLGGMSLSSELEYQLSKLKPAIYIGFGMTETVSHIALRKMGNQIYEALEGIELETSGDCLVVSDSHLGIRAMQTNDQVELIDPKHFNWLGRADFVINSGGIKIHPEKIEQLIGDLIPVPYLVGSLPHEEFGEMCVLVVESLLSPEKFKQVQELVREIFGKYAVPKQQVVYPILKTGNGKIRRKEILNALLDEQK